MILLALAGCATWGGPFRRAPSPEPGTAQIELRFGGEARTYLLHVPPHPPRRFTRSEPYPLIVVLHGSGAAGETVRHMSRLDSLADLRDFVVAYPDGTRNWLGLQSGWNAGDCCGAAVRNEVDDVGFLRALVAEVSSALPVDPRRIYVAGFSDGARMAYRVGCEMSDEIAAIAVVAGSLTQRSCSPSRPIPLIAFHGTSDDEVPFTDSTYSPRARSRVETPTVVPPAVSFWASNNGCRWSEATHPAKTIHEVLFTGCRAEVAFFAIEGGGHAWPGGAQDGDDGDPPTRALSASAELVRFFLQHPLQ